jgi:hypothetical protein
MWLVTATGRGTCEAEDDDGRDHVFRLDPAARQVRWKQGRFGRQDPGGVEPADDALAAVRHQQAVLPVGQQAIRDRIEGAAARLARDGRGAERPGIRVQGQQTISTLPADFAGSSFGSEILVSADGRHVYAGNRLHDSIAISSVGSDGGLTLIGDKEVHRGVGIHDDPASSSSRCSGTADRT